MEGSDKFYSLYPDISQLENNKSLKFKLRPVSEIQDCFSEENWERIQIDSIYISRYVTAAELFDLFLVKV